MLPLARPWMPFLAAVPFDAPWPLVVAALAVAAVCLLLWSQAGQRPFLVAMVVSLVVAAGAIVADRVVVTDRERVEDLFPRLARAAEAGDAATILDAFDPDVAIPRAEAERALREFHPEEVRITRLDVTLHGPPDDRRARAEILAHARGDARFTGGAGPVAVLVDLSVDLRKAGDRFLITGFRERPGNPIERR